MSSPFSNLSHDLILQIADLLWEEEDVRDPWPLITNLTMSFGERAVYNLSRTSTSLYKLLSPYTFRSITLRNTKKSGRALQYLLSTSQVASIKTLHFKCKIPGGKEEDSPSIEKVFPTEVNDVLSNLSKFPRLATLIIDLRLDSHCRYVFYDDSDDDDLQMVCKSKRIERKIKMTEEQKRCRAMLEKTLKAISATCSDDVREFVLKQCPIRTNSLFSEPFNEVRQLAQYLHDRQFFHTFQADISPSVKYHLLYLTRLGFPCSQNGFRCPTNTRQWLGRLESFRFEEHSRYVGPRRYVNSFIVVDFSDACPTQIYALTHMRRSFLHQICSIVHSDLLYLPHGI